MSIAYGKLCTVFSAYLYQPSFNFKIDYFANVGH